MACSLGNEIIHDDPSAETVKKELDSVKQRWADVDVVLRQRLNLDEEKEKGEGIGNEIGVAVREIESWLSETEARVIDVNVEACEQKDGSFVDVSGRVSKLEVRYEISRPSYSLYLYLRFLRIGSPSSVFIRNVWTVSPFALFAIPLTWSLFAPFASVSST